MGAQEVCVEKVREIVVVDELFHCRLGNRKVIDRISEELAYLTFYHLLYFRVDGCRKRKNLLQ